MKTTDSKRRPRLDSSFYCAHCYIRLGIGERHLQRDGKAYHYTCYAKLKDTQSREPAKT